VVVLPYSQEFADLTPEQFIREYLLEQFQAQVVVLGADAQFGKDNSGNTEFLRRFSNCHCGLDPQSNSADRDFGSGSGMTNQSSDLDLRHSAQSKAEPQNLPIEVVEVGPVGELGKPRWSSSAARVAILSGDFVSANEILGRAHFITGKVIQGDQRGRTLGFPTANLSEIQGLLPPPGVYAAWAGHKFPAAVSIGTNPTFTDSNELRVEAHLIDQTGLDLYGQEVTLEFVSLLRLPKKFGSRDELVAQLHQDIADARANLLCN
jgi:riboflavin kinase/FMN adenylyltransferase